MQLSHSRVQTFVSCPYKFKLSYIDGLTAIFNCEPQNALVLGHALHTGIEKTIDEAVREYYGAYPVITDLHVNEALKLIYWLDKIKKILPEGLHEVKIEDEDYLGFIDLLVPVNNIDKPAVCDRCGANDLCQQAYYNDCPLDKFHYDINDGDEVFDLYDFKYSNNVNNYMDSEQLHLYKYYFEKHNPGKKIRNMYFMFVPKTNIRMKYKNKTNKRDETLFEFRQRMFESLDRLEIQFVQIKYQPEKVIDFLTNGKHLVESTDYPKNETRLCDWCDFKDYCQKGEDYMLLPKNERREISKINKKVIWLYGAPFSGKTFLANQFPDPIMLNSDGNIKFVDAPYIAIKDIVTMSGRVKNKQLAWDVFKEVIGELEKKQNDFKTIVVDLLEDMYEYCRLYMYDQMGITHESDDSFRAWDKVRTEFLSTIKRLINLDYENIILISHEDTSKDIVKRNDKITAIKPNINDKVANKVAGMVDIVARVIADDNKRVLSFKNNEVIFGGGRLSVTTNEIPCEYDELMKVYEEANGAIKTVEKQVNSNTSEPAVQQATSEPEQQEQATNATATTNVTTTNDDVQEVKSEAQAEEAPTTPGRRTRRTRTTTA